MVEERGYSPDFLTRPVEEWFSREEIRVLGERRAATESMVVGALESADEALLRMGGA
jgi:hypothetical protein